jgi:hypothetical protein
MNDEHRQPTDEERETLLREELKRLRVVDVAGEVMVTLVTLGYQKMGLTAETLELRRLDDARLAIELLRGMIETLEREHTGDVAAFRSTLAAMQLQFARVAVLPEGTLPSAEAPTPGDAGERPPEAGGRTEPPASKARQRPADGGDTDAASRLWVPPGARGKDNPL